MRPLVTVAVPAYNHAAYVAEAVHSILDENADGTVHVVAVDDVSSDGTYDVLLALAKELPHLTVLRNERNLGSAATLMRGLAGSESPYVAALASDDRWTPGRLAKQLAVLESGAQWSFGQAHVIDATGARTSTEPQGPPPDPDGMLRTLLRGQAIYAPTLMYRRDFLHRAGGVNDAMLEDLAVTLRFASLAEPAFVPEPLLEYRVHGTNVHLTIAQRRLHFAAHAEAVRSLLAWDGLPAEHRAVVTEHARVWLWLEGFSDRTARVGELRGLDRATLDAVVRRQAPEIVAKLPGDDVLRLEVALRLRGATGAARAIAGIRGPLARRAVNRAVRQASRVRSRALP
jgi:glycosyltransferase involved in cell wall biosynthesis